jgi:hypothetical protein
MVPDRAAFSRRRPPDPAPQRTRCKRRAAELSRWASRQRDARSHTHTTTPASRDSPTEVSFAASAPESSIR